MPIIHSEGDEVVWEDPSVLDRRKGPLGIWMKRLGPLLDKPGKWAMVFETSRASAYSTIRNLHAGRYRVPPGQWEFTSRVDDLGNGRVYARWVGEQVGEQDEEG